MNASALESHRDGLSIARRACALVQHHDGITGTARTEVVADYNAKLDGARRLVHDALATSTHVSLSKSTALSSLVRFESVPLAPHELQQFGIAPSSSSSDQQKLFLFSCDIGVQVKRKNDFFQIFIFRLLGSTVDFAKYSWLASKRIDRFGFVIDIAMCHYRCSS